MLVIECKVVKGLIVTKLKENKIFTNVKLYLEMN